MSDKPKGLDLSKLLKKGKEPAPAETPVETPAAPSPPDTQAAPAAPSPAAAAAAKVDLSKLLKKETPAPPTAAHPTPSKEPLDLLFGAKPAAPTNKPAPPAARKPLPPPVAAKPNAQPPKPALQKPIEKPSSVATPSTAASAVAGTDGVDSSHVATRFVAKVDDIASQQGAKRLRLDVTIGDDRRYPRGFFGVDELFLGALDWTNIARTKAWRAPGRHKSGYSVHLQTVGQSSERASIVWDGNDVCLHMNQLVGEASAERQCPTDAFIDVVRGTLDCKLLSRVPGAMQRGNIFLLHCMGLQDGTTEESTLQALLEAQETRRDFYQSLRRAAKDAPDYFTRMYEDVCALAATGFTDPYFIRVRFETEPFVELLFHFESGKLSVFRGKPGETLVEGAAELRFSNLAARVFFEGEADLLFLCRAGKVTAHGDLRVLARANFLSLTSLEMLRFMDKTGGVISESNIMYTPLVKGPLYDALGEVMDFGG